MRRLTMLLPALLAACSGGPRLGEAVTVARANAASPTVAVDSATGRVYVAWVQQGGQRLGRLPGDGGVVVAWVTNLRPDSAVVSDISVRLARSDDQGRSFGAVATFAGAPTGLSRANMYYDLAAGPGGTLYLSWLDLHWYTDTVAHRTLHHVPDSVPVPEDRVEFRVAASRDGGRSFTRAWCSIPSPASAAAPPWRKGPDGGARSGVTSSTAASATSLSASSDDGAASFALPVRVHEDGWVLNGCPDTGGDLWWMGRGWCTPPGTPAPRAGWASGTRGATGRRAGSLRRCACCPAVTSRRPT
ncbi:MAG: hypothetical protein IPK12_05100 [Gemmatimonadetes bacterium]|nr:hypothetical protein [Gemmatimonadota bacterium]